MDTSGESITQVPGTNVSCPEARNRLWNQNIETFANVYKAVWSCKYVANCNLLKFVVEMKILFNCLLELYFKTMKQTLKKIKEIIYMKHSCDT